MYEHRFEKYGLELELLLDMSMDSKVDIFKVGSNLGAKFCVKTIESMWSNQWKVSIRGNSIIVEQEFQGTGSSSE